MANRNPTGNCLKDMSHIVKFDGTNYFDWKYEFLGILEQHGLRQLVQPVNGGEPLPRPNAVSINCIPTICMQLCMRPCVITDQSYLNAFTHKCDFIIKHVTHFRVSLPIKRVEPI